MFGSLATLPRLDWLGKAMLANGGERFSSPARARQKLENTYNELLYKTTKHNKSCSGWLGKHWQGYQMAPMFCTSVLWAWLY